MVTEIVSEDCDGNSIPDECQIPVYPEVICKECMRGDNRTGHKCSYDVNCKTCSGTGKYCTNDVAIVPLGKRASPWKYV